MFAIGNSDNWGVIMEGLSVLLVTTIYKYKMTRKNDS